MGMYHASFEETSLMQSLCPPPRIVAGAFAIMGLAVVLSGCSSIIGSATAGLADSLAGAISNQNDPETVRQGAPAYLLLIDGLIADDPHSPALLSSGARLYSTYATAFVDDPHRQKLLAAKAREYGWQAMCAARSPLCGLWERPFEEFEAAVKRVDRDEIDLLYGCAAAWATWVQANRDDWIAVADKARVDEMMQRVLALDEGYERGGAHLYLGVLATLLPEALGGQPEKGREHFERAIEISKGQNLMAKVLMAREYARLVFDRELHDRLCHEVIDFDTVVDGLTLSNTLAREEAERLLADSDDYFGE
jgi:hypothetical protein